MHTWKKSGSSGVGIDWGLRGTRALGSAVQLDGGFPMQSSLPHRAHTVAMEIAE